MGTGQRRVGVSADVLGAEVHAPLKLWGAWAGRLGHLGHFGTQNQPSTNGCGDRGGGPVAW